MVGCWGVGVVGWVGVRLMDRQMDEWRDSYMDGCMSNGPAYQHIQRAEVETCRRRALSVSLKHKFEMT